MTFKYDPRLNDLLDRIESTFVNVVPNAVRKKAINEPCYALILWYDDSSVGDHTPQFAILTRSILDACNKQDESSRLYCYWSPQQNLYDDTSLRQLVFSVTELRSLCDEAYKKMLAANRSQLPLEDERDILMPYRAMMRRAAKRLAEFDWAKVLTVEDSFVVVALDYMGNWLEEDLEAGLTNGQRSKLLKQGLLIKSK
jgi:hypothetical protein